MARFHPNDTRDLPLSERGPAGYGEHLASEEEQDEIMLQFKGGRDPKEDEQDSIMKEFMGDAYKPESSEIEAVPLGPPDPLPGQAGGEREPPGMIESALKGVARGFTADTIDEMEGGLAYLGGGSYKETRDLKREDIALQKMTNPASSFAGELVGSVVGLGKFAAAKKGLTALAGRGAAVGAAYGYGASEAEEWVDQLIDTAFGTVGGIFGAGAGKVVQKGFQTGQKGALKMSDYFNAKAGERAVMQGGAKTLPVTRRLTDKKLYPSTATPRAPGFDTRKAELGEEMIMEQSPGIQEAFGSRTMMGKGPITSTQKIMHKADLAVEYLGKKIGQFGEKMDHLFVEIQRKAKIFESHGMGSKLPGGLASARDHLDAYNALNAFPNPRTMMIRLLKMRNQWAKDPAYSQYVGALDHAINFMERQPNKPMSFSQAVQWKRSFDEIINYAKKEAGGPTPNWINKKIRGAIAAEINDSVERVSTLVRERQISAAYKELNRKYGVFAQISELATDWVERGKANMEIGLRDIIAFGGGMNVGWKTGVATGAASWAARKYGNSALSTGLRGARNAARGIGHGSSKLIPGAGAAIGAVAGSQDREPKDLKQESFKERTINATKGSKFETEIQKGARVNENFNAMFFRMHHSSPEFRKLLEEKTRQ